MDQSCPRSELPSFFSTYLSFISPGFGELEYFDLELGWIGSEPDLSISWYTVWRNELRVGLAAWDNENQTANQHIIWKLNLQFN